MRWCKFMMISLELSQWLADQKVNCNFWSRSHYCFMNIWEDDSPDVNKLLFTFQQLRSAVIVRRGHGKSTTHSCCNHILASWAVNSSSLTLNTLISLDVLLVLWYCLLTNWSQRQCSSVLEDLVYLESLSLLAEYGANINHVAVTQVNHGNSKPARVTEVNVQSLMTLVKQRARHELLLAQSCHNLDGLP